MEKLVCGTFPHLKSPFLNVHTVNWNMPTASLQQDKTPLNKCPGCDTNPASNVKLQSLNFGECRVPLYCHYSQVYSDLEWLYLVRVTSMGQIELFNHLLRIIMVSYLKPYSYVQIDSIHQVSRSICLLVCFTAYQPPWSFNADSG